MDSTINIKALTIFAAQKLTKDAINENKKHYEKGVLARKAQTKILGS